MEEVLREKELLFICRVIEASQSDGQVLFIRGYPGAGKSTLFDQLNRKLQNRKELTTRHILLRFKEYDVGYERLLFQELVASIIDNDLSQYFRRFLSSITLSIGPISLSGQPIFSEEKAEPLRKSVTRFIEDLQEFSSRKSKESFVLILDDFHKISSPVFRSLVYEIAHSVPTKVTLIISTRERQKRASLAELKAQEYELPFFTRSQIAEFLMKNLNLDPQEANKQAQVLERKVMGHPYAISNAVLLSMIKNESLKVLLEKMPALGWEEACTYIAEEVMSKLGEDEKSLLECCFILPYFGNEICSYMMGRKTTFPILGSLERRGQIIAEDSGRYSIHELTKSYLSEVIVSKDQLYRHAADFFVAQVSVPQEERAAQNSARYSLYACEFLSKAHDYEALGKFLVTTGESLLASGYSRELEPYVARVVTQARSSTVENAGHLLLLHGDLCKILCRYRESLPAYRSALRAVNIQHAPGKKARALLGIAEVYRRTAEYSKALLQYERAIKAFDAVEKQGTGRADALWGIGTIYLLHVEYEKALDCFQEAERIHRLNENTQGLAWAIWGIATAERMLFDYRAAKDYAKGLRICEANGYKRTEAWTLWGIADAHHMFAKYRSALHNFRKAADICNRIGDSYGIAWSLRGIAKTYFMLSELSNAVEYYSQAAKKFKSVNDGYVWANVIRCIARIYQVLWEHDVALKYYQEADAAFLKYQDEWGRVDALFGATIIEASHSTDIGMIKKIKEIGRIYEQNKSGSLEEMIYVSLACGEASRACCDYDSAMKYFRKALTQAKRRERSQKPQVAHAILGIAETKRMQGISGQEDYDKTEKIYSTIEMKLGIVNTFIGRALASLKVDSLASETNLDNAERLAKQLGLNHELTLINKIRVERNPMELHRLIFP